MTAQICVQISVKFAGNTDQNVLWPTESWISCVSHVSDAEKLVIFNDRWKYAVGTRYTQVHNNYTRNDNF